MKNKTVKKITVTAMLTAIAIILGYFAFPIFPQVPFLEYDLCDVAVLIASFIFGPVYGVCSSFAVAIFQAFLLDKSGIFGFVMNIISTTAFVLPASLIYLSKKTKKTAALALTVGIAVMSVVMVVFNYFVTPLFMGVDRSVILTLMPFIIAFNLVKSIVNSVITFLIYKHIGNIIRKYNQ